MERVADKNILGFWPIPELLKMFAWPAIISMLASSLYNIIDQIFIGHAVGYLGIAATTYCFSLGDHCYVYGQSGRSRR